MQRCRYISNHPLHPNSKIPRQRRQKPLQIFPSQSPSDRYQNLPHVFRPLEAILIMEKVRKLALLLLQHYIEADRGGGSKYC